jgi:hypothetical protein
MKIRIVKEKELKTGMMSGKAKDVGLRLSISVSLTEAERKMREKYGYLRSLVDAAAIQRMYEKITQGTAEGFQFVMIDTLEPEISKFGLVAHVNSVVYLPIIQRFEEAVIRALENEMENWKALDAWEGDIVISIPEEEK